jgi:hypothetical protein
MIEKLDRDSLMEKITAEPYLAPEVLMGIFMYLGGCIMYNKVATEEQTV